MPVQRRHDLGGGHTSVTHALADRLQEIGYALAIYPAVGFPAAAVSAERLFNLLKDPRRQHRSTGE